MTGFYESHLLVSAKKSADRYGRTGCFTLPNIEEFAKTLDKTNRNYYKHFEQLDKNWKDHIDFKFSFNNVQNIVTISICIMRGEEAIYTLARVTLSTIDSNCGSLLISNLQSELRGTKIGSWLLEQVISYARRADYSLLLLNTAGTYQNPLGKYIFQKKYGFSPIKDLVYINKRSGNVNVWYKKYLYNVQEVSYDDLDLAKNPHEDEDDDL